jgi:hypothetical protein
MLTVTKNNANTRFTSPAASPYLASFTASVARHRGKFMHPQNCCPTDGPCLAVRRTIAAPHLGQVFVTPAVGGAGGVVLLDVFAECAGKRNEAA